MKLPPGDMQGEQLESACTSLIDLFVLHLPFSAHIRSQVSQVSWSFKVVSVQLQNKLFLI